MSTITIVLESPAAESSTAQVSARQPADGARALSATPPARAALVARLAARISASTREIAPFAGVDRAVDAIAESLFRNRRVVLAQPVADRIARSARARAASVVEADWRSARADAARGSSQAAAFDALVRSARDADALVLTSPFIAGDGTALALAPRDLLRLRARAPRPVFVLDLLDEDLARAPLTQAALLIPGTVILRGFGRLWRDAGAATAADIAFAAGAPDLIASLSAASEDDSVDEEFSAAAVRDLDQPWIERSIQEAATRARVPFGRD